MTIDIDTVLAIAAKHANPERDDIEYQNRGEKLWRESFSTNSDGMLSQIINHGGKYRTKPKTFTINGVDIEKPEINSAYPTSV